jgi:hypothetical protein
MKKIRTKWLVAMAGLGLCLAWLAIASPFGGGSIAPPDENPVPAGWGEIGRDAWPVGQKRTYDVNLSTTLVGKGEQGTQEFALTADLHMALTAFARTSHATSVRVELSAEQVRQRKNGAESVTTADFNHALEKPFAISIAHSGTIVQIYLETGSDPMVHGIVRALISGLQFVPPADGKQLRWSNTETDSTGEFVAEYQRVSELGFKKSRRKYIGGIDQSFGLRKRDRTGITELKMLDDGTPRLVDSRYVEVLDSDRAKMRAETRVHMRLTAVERVQVEAVVMSKRNAGTLAAPPTSIRRPADHYAQLAAGQSVAGVLRQLEQSDRDDPHARSALMHKLEAVIRMQGDAAAAEAAASVRSLANDADAQIVMGALDDAQTPAAQRALRELASDANLSSDQRITAIMHLGLGADPTAETLEGLQHMVDSPELNQEQRDTALMALGGSLRNADPMLKAPIEASMDYLLGQATTARTAQEHINAISSLGNTGNSAAMSTLEQALKSPEAPFRAAGVSGLRHMQEEKVDALIAGTARDDDDAQVRSYALGTLRYRSLTSETKAALLAAAEQDPDVSVRLVAVDVLAEHMDKDTTLVAALLRSSKRDANETVRSRAHQLLEGGTGQ